MDDRLSGRIPDPEGLVRTRIIDGQIVERKCGGCGLWQTPERKLERCGQCRRVYYCSRQCQLADWKTHKVGCKK